MKRSIETSLLLVIFFLQISFLALLITGKLPLTNLSQNTVQLVSALISAVSTITAALIAVTIAFSQLKKQFEHKVIYEAWSDLQQKLHGFASELTEFSVKIQSLLYLRNNQGNQFLNGGNKGKYRQDRWQELTTSHDKMLQAYVLFLRSYETNEIIFLNISHAKRKFQSEFQKSTDVTSFNNFSEKIFPEIYGRNEFLSDEEMGRLVNQYWEETINLSIYLSEDLRRLLQNETIGKILNKKVECRKPDRGHKILLKEGFRIQR